MPSADYASQGVEYSYHNGLCDFPFRSRLNTSELYCQDKEQFKQVLYVRSESRPPICTTKVPSSELNENYANENLYIDQSLDVNDDDVDFSSEDELNDNYSKLQNNNNVDTLNNNINNNCKPSFYSGIPVEAFPDSLIKWPPKYTTKTKRLAEIKKQVKQLSSIIKMTIANDSLNENATSTDSTSPKNPVPFSKHVDMSLIDCKEIGLSSDADLPSWDDLKPLLMNKHFKEAKQMVRDSDYGLNHSIRADLWKEFCKHHANEAFVDDFYWDTVKQMYGSTNLSECHSNLPAFVDHQHLISRALSQEGIEVCRRIISVIGFLNPSITYAPLVYPLTAIMLHYMEEADVFNCINVLINSSNNMFITQTKVSHEAMWRATVKLARKHVRGSFSTLMKLGITADQIDSSFQNYVWWILAGLPLPHLMRIMDCFFLEGSKVLLRCALAIIHILSKTCTRDSNMATTLTTRGILEATNKLCHEINMPPGKFLKTAFGIRGFSKNEINQVVLKTEMMLKSSRLPSDGTGERHSLSRSASLEGLPTSASQTDVQMMSHTLTIREGSRSPSPRVRAMGEYPINNIKSKIASADQLLTVWSWLPIRKTMHQPILIYTTEEHGSSLTTFYQRTEKHYPTLLLIRTTNDHVFGAYCSTALEERNLRDASGHRQTYFGTGETFVFSLKPDMVKHQWVGITRQQQDRQLSNVDHSSELFIHADNDMISIGGGEGQAIFLDHELRFGKTETCQTFANPPLCPDKDFDVKVIEVYGLSEV